MLRYIPHILSMFLLFGLWTGLSDCKTQESSSSTGQECDHQAVVQDFIGLDGCQFLLKLQDGRLASPVSWPIATDSLYDGMPVQISFEEAEEMAGTCMKEDLFIRLNCLQLPEDSSRTCLHRIGPTESEWMKEVFLEEEPWEVVRYEGTNIHYFYFQKPGKGVLYNCYGDSICDIPGRIYNACARKLTRLKNNKVIWKKDEQ